MIQLLDITTFNGARHTIDYNYRKTHFKNEKELDDYRNYLESKLRLKLYFIKKYLD